MRCAILGFVAGAALLQTRASLPMQAALLACALGAVAALVAARALAQVRSRAWPAARLALHIGAGAVLGFCWAALLAKLAMAPQLARTDEGRDLTVIGVVDSLPYRFGQGVRFNFVVERVLDPAARVPPHIALGWYNGDAGAAADVQPGERWQLRVRLQRPHGVANPDGFDYEVWLLEQGLRATGYVRGAGLANRRIDAFVPSVGNLIESWRATLRARIERALAGKPYAGVIVALVVGDQRAIEQSDWTVFNRTGIGHLVSISGLHITMIAGMFAMLASTLWRRSFFTGAQLPLVLPAQKVAALAGAGVALLYVLLAGFGVPAQRTLYMLSVVAAALWFGRLTSVSHVLCAALGIVVLLDPWAPLWPGFWLSFGAVGMILYASVGRTGIRNAGLWQAIKQGAHTQYVVTLGLVPLTMLLFAQVSLVSPVANAIAIPLVSFIVTPLALAGSVLPAPLSDWALGLAHLMVEALVVFLKWIGNQRFALWSAPLPAPWMFCWALFGTLWTLAPRGWPLRPLGMVAWLPLLVQTPSHPEDGQFRVTAFDVGQGMALLIETSGHRLLYDTGPMYSPQSNAGERVIVPYLKARGIAVLDGVIVTHSDADHSGGALAVFDAVRVGWTASSLAQGSAIVRAAPMHRRCTAGQDWRWDGVHFEMLHPDLASYADGALKSNARGCTLRISAGGRAMLLAADIEAEQEAQLVARSREKLRADVLLAPHHGSGTSSTPAFLRAVQADVAIFQVGYRNRYHHPKAQVFARYGELGVRRLRTDESGALTLDFGPRLEVREYRSDHARYWYDR
ncbi:MAG: DNA internalization-related competence protein ComEC/Rec2 [Pseudomonadota bacterium]